jgi:protein-tyrosine phosphatase
MNAPTIAMSTDDTNALVRLSIRHLLVPGTYNMRDLGGYCAAGSSITRWGTLYRADALHRLDDESRRTLQHIGLRTVVDLRSDDEVKRAPNQLGSLDIRIVRMPLFGQVARGSALGAPRRTLAEVYAHVADDRAEVLAGAVRELAAADALPAIVHCTIGKDRTGMVVAIVLSLLGVDDKVIAEDFTETERHLRGAFRDELVSSHSDAGLSIHEIDEMLSVDPAFILGFLDRLCARWHDVPTFLAHHGVTEEEVARLRAKLLVDQPVAPRSFALANKA